MRLPTLRWHTIKVLLLMFVAVLMQSTSWADPQPGKPRDFGVGAMLGAPTGLSLKYWLTETAAMDGGLAWHFGDDARFQIHSDYLYHIFVPNWQVPGGRLPVYVGAGLRVLAGDHPE